MSRANVTIWTPTFVSLTCIGFLTALSFSMLIPTLPRIALDELQAKPNQLGWILGLFTASVLLSRVWIDRFTRSFGSGKLLAASTAMLVAVMASYFFVTNVGLLYLVRVAHGICFGLITTSTAAMSIGLVSKERRGKAIGYYGMAQASSMAAGPVAGEALMSHSPNFLFFSLLAFVSLSWFLAVFAYKRYPRHRRTNNEAIGKSRWFERKVIPAAAQMLFLATVFGCVLSYLSVYAEMKGLGEWTGAYFLCYALSLFFIRPLSGRWADSPWVSHSVWGGLGSMALSLSFLVMETDVAGFLLSGMFLGIGFGICQTALQAISLRDVQADRYTAATGTFYLSLDLGFSLGAILFGGLTATFPIPILFQWLFLAIGISGGLLMFSQRAGRRRRARPLPYEDV